MLKKNTGYQLCPLFVQLQSDVERYLKRTAQKVHAQSAIPEQAVASAAEDQAAYREDHDASSGGGCSYSPHIS